MKAPNHILVALDLYDNYEPLLQRAISLAKQFNTALHIVHVIPHILSTIPYAYDFQSDIENEAKTKLDKIKLDIQAVSIVTHLLHGTPKNEIVKLADSLHIDLLIIGSHGQHGIDLLLGSTANGILHLANCNVLTIHIDINGIPTTTGQYKRILLASDLHEDARIVADAANTLRQQFNAELHAINVIPDSTIISTMYTAQVEMDLKAEAKPRIQKLMSELGTPINHAEVIIGHPKTEILAYAKHIQAEMLVIGSHGRKGLAAILLGSTANAILHGATTDIFVVRIDQ